MAKHTKILDGAYEVLGLVPGPVGYKSGIVDLSKITAAEAAELVRSGFPYLRKVTQRPKKQKAED